MDQQQRDRADGFGGQRPDPQSDPRADHRWGDPYGARSLGAATDRVVQLDRGAVERTAGDGAVQAVADHGTSGAATSLPHLDAIQRSFGHHDVGQVRAHVDERAGTAAAALGAQAYATGDHVAFDGAPGLHTAAHEAAHVVQQRGGVQLEGGLGAGDDAYERHADLVADRVVRGESAEALLDQHAGGAASTAVQRKPSDLRRTFAHEEQLNLSVSKRLLRPSWNAYFLNVTPYFRIDDHDASKQASALPHVATVERQLREDALAESKAKNPDTWKTFTPAQLELAGKIARALDEEKSAVFGGELGTLDRNEKDVPSHRVKDAHVVHGGDGLVGHENPNELGNELFPRTPAITDVQQGNLGDCYLLAAVASVVQRDPDHFVKHMRDNVDGTVTVKLYTGVDQPVMITVDKTVVGDRYARNVLWVKLLEKAYMASGLKTKDVGKELGDDSKRKYKDVEGGSSDLALLHLTGHAAATFTLGRGRLDFQDKAPKLAMEAVDKTKVAMKASTERQQQLKASIEGKLKLDDKADVKADREQLELETKAFEALVLEWQSIEGPRQELEDLLTRVYVSRATFQKFVEKHGKNELLQKVLQTSGLTENTLPGELGSGVYGKDDIDAYAQIAAALDAKKPLTASTKRAISDPDNPEEKERGQAGEAKVNGLAAAHCYTILDYAPKAKDYKAGDRVVIKLRNPWGYYGRAYQKIREQVKGVADNEGDGTFWIDLADLVAYFDSIAMLA